AATPSTAGATSTLPVSACFTYNDRSYVDCTLAAAEADASTFLPFTTMLDSEPALYLGLDRPFAPRPFTLYLQVEPPQPEDVAAEMLAAPQAANPARVLWEYASADGWALLGALDETAALTRRGLVHFIGPA